MRIALALVAVVVIFLVSVHDAAAATTAVSIDLRPSGAVFVAPRPLRPFTLAGVRWQGPGRVEFRTRSVTGWSAWRAGAPELDEGPDPLGVEQRRSGWRVGNPWWVGEAQGIEARAVGRVGRIRAELVSSAPVRIPYRRPAMTQTPAIVSRAAWGADESIRRGTPAYAAAARFVIVHHTAGTTDYSRVEAPAIVRGIERFHVQSNGWNDIGYNFLVDRFGTVYEGRYGGVDRNVVGAHALGFNTGSVGIALIGTYGATPPSRAALDALERLVAWRLDMAHVDPTSSLTVVSGGSEKYANGVPVQLHAVSAHRDTGSTECPGDLLYARLGEVAAQARAIGGPKIFEPRAEATGDLVRVRAQLSAPLSWSVVVSTKGGVEVARGTGTGTAVDWTWDVASAPAGGYTWSVAAPGARPATGTVKTGGGAPPPVIESATLSPGAISPNGDGQADTALLSYRLTAPATVTVQIADTAGVVVGTPVLDAPATAGDNTAVVSADGLPDGSYSVSLIARFSDGTTAQATFPLTIARMLGLVSVSPGLFSPNGDGRNDRLEIAFVLTAPASVRIRIEREGRWVATPYVADLQPGEQRFIWDGRRAAGPSRDGGYTVVVEATGSAGAIAFGVPFTVDTTPPRVRLLRGRRIRIEVSEAALLTVRAGAGLVTRDVRRAGVVLVRWPGQPARVRVVATDAAGNRSAVAVARRGKDGELRQ